MKIKDHFIENIDQSLSKNTGGELTPDSIVIHFTAGSSLDSSIQWMNRKNSKVSCHLAIGQDGKTIQIVPFNKIAWHAGKSSHHGIDGLNKCAIGIEIDNAGRLEPSVEMGSFISWFGKEYDHLEVIGAIHKNENQKSYWHKYTHEQISIVQEICELLIEEYPTIKYILGHDEISPERKIDPGPAFPIDKIRDRLLYSDRHLEEKADEHWQMLDEDIMGEIKVREFAHTIPDSLNFRESPSIHGVKIISDGLPQDTKVEIIDCEGNWSKVKIEGYVSTKYLKGDNVKDN